MFLFRFLKTGMVAVLSLLYSAAAMAESCEQDILSHPEFWKSVTLEQVTTCIEEGINLDRRYGFEFTPLIPAIAFSANPEVTRALIDAGADINRKNIRGRTPLHVAAITRYSENLRLLIAAGPDFEAVDGNGNSAIHFGANHATNRQNIELLLEAGFVVNQPNEHGRTPIFQAAYNTSNPDVMRTLIEAGADVNYTLPRGLTALHLATDVIGGLENMNLLLDAGADPNKYAASISPLFFATIPSTDNEDFAKVNVLVDAGADLHRPIGLGNYILHALIENGIWSRDQICRDVSPIIANMIERGADPNQQNRAGESAFDTLDIAMSYNKCANESEIYQKILGVLSGE